MYARLVEETTDIHISPRPRCVVVTNHTTDTEHLPHDRECPQASLILRGQVRDLHLPVRGYLPFYFIVGASLQNSKLHKVKVKSKTQLACHLLRLL
jgi:hypothetical protein